MSADRDLTFPAEFCPNPDMVAFDADDTLWHCERNFQEIQARFCELMAPWQEGDLAARDHLDAVERRNLATFGYGVKGFTLSMIETAIMLSDGGVTGDDVQRIIDWARELLAADIDILEGVEGVLGALGAHRLALVTKGDLLEQEAKVAASGLGDHFDVVEVVAEKDVAAYRRLLGRHGVPPDGFVMVGNSVRSDILPVITLGGWAVHVPSAFVWAHEEAEAPVGHERFREVAALADVVDLLGGGGRTGGQVPIARSPASPSPGKM